MQDRGWDRAEQGREGSVREHDRGRARAAQGQGHGRNKERQDREVQGWAGESKGRAG